MTGEIGTSVFPGSSEDQTTPMLVTALKGLKVVDVACGSGDAQTLAVTENGKRSQYGRLCDGRILSPPLKCFIAVCFHRSGVVLGGWRLRQTGPRRQ